MTKLTLFVSVLLTGFFAWATTQEDARLVAESTLNAPVTLNQESAASYFFVTEFEGQDDSPCIRGVVVNKASGEVVSPSSDPAIHIVFPYSDTRIQGLVVFNCAD